MFPDLVVCFGKEKLFLILAKDSARVPCLCVAGNVVVKGR